MPRETFDLGIDLGTTNSCAAVYMPQGPEIVRVGGRDYLPSVIYKRGSTTYIGDKAYQAIADERRWNDVQYEFKRMMGSQHHFTFASANISLTAEELSAEVLKELAGAVEERYSERFTAAVITVPAWFESVQREATLRAGQAAGFSDVVLLQEPVAASLGYGYGINDTSQQTWLVFDLGGGTLDVALIESVDGELRVINHIGDNYRGGKDLDWIFLEQLLGPKISECANIPPFAKTDKFWRILKPLAEQAKIELSSRTITQIDTDRDGVETVTGAPLRLVIEVTRNEYEALITTWIDEAIQFGATLLKESGVSSSQVARTLLVGGPTYTPLLRRRIVERLGIPVEVQAIDPMTVVARGAAVFAGSRRITNTTNIKAPGGSVASVTLHYKPVYADVDPMIAGEVDPASDITTIELHRDDGTWSSGRVSLLNSTFMTRVLLEAGKRHTFTIRAYNRQGSFVPTTPSVFTISQGLAVAPPTCAMSYKLPAHDGFGRQQALGADTLIEKGRPLPCRNTGTYRAIKGLKAGCKDDAIRIPIVEGEFSTLDYNRHVGTVLISGDAIAHSLPEGSEIQVTLSVDENGIPSVDVYVPFLEQHFRTLFKNRVMQQVDYQSLADHLADDEDRAAVIIEELGSGGADAVIRPEQHDNASEVQEAISELHDTLLAEEMTTVEDLQKIERKRKELAEKIDLLAAALEIPRAVKAIQDTIAWAEDIVSQHGSSDDRAAFEEYRQEAMNAINANSLTRIQHARSEIQTITWRILFKIDDFWIGTFQSMRQQEDQFTDPVRAQTLLRAGSQALARQDMDALKNIVWELWDLFPEPERLVGSHRFESDLRKA